MNTGHNRLLLERMEALGAHLMRLKPDQKQPAAAGWTTAVVVPAAEAEAYVASGGNIGVNQALSRLIVLDAEDAAATSALQFAGFELTVITAKGQMPSSPKYGGSHVWLRVPDGIEAGSLPSDKLGIRLTGGGKLDALAGRRYVVAPPSRLAEAPDFQYAAALGGLLDLNTPPRDIPVAPAWLFTLASVCPEGLEPLHGILAPNPTGLNGTEAYDRATASGKSIELSEKVDEIPWDEWIGGDHRLTDTGAVDGCGCPVWHWQGSSNMKSATLHDGCSAAGGGHAAHLWGDTMAHDLNLQPQGTYSRLQLSAALKGVPLAEAAKAVGIELGERVELQGIQPRELEAAADAEEAAGDLEQARKFREAAKNLRADIRDASEQRGETFTTARVLGGVDPKPIIVPNGSNAQTSEQSSEQSSEQLDDQPSEQASPSAETDDDDDRRDIGGEVRTIDENVIRSFPGVPFDQIPRARGDELHEYPHPQFPPDLDPVKGAKIKTVTVLPPIANRRGHDLVPHEWIFQATPGLSHVAAAADARGVYRWGLLAAVLPRIAAKIPPTVRLIPSSRSIPEGTGPTDAGTSLNLFSVLVGPSGSGKTNTMTAAAVLLPGVRTIAPGTGEGVLKEFPRAGDSDEDDNESDDSADNNQAPQINNLVGESADSLIVESDEIDVFVGEMKRQGTKTSAWYRSMWMGGSIGNTASDRDRRSHVAAHSYRFGIILGAQPGAAAPLFLESDLGTPQRFLWVFAQQSVVRGRYDERLQVPEVDWYGTGPSMIPEMTGSRPPVWVTPSPAGIHAADVDRARAATVDPVDPAGRNDDDKNTALSGQAEAIYTPHAVLQQIKISALLAAMDGLTQPQDIHWHAAGAIMAVRERAIELLVQTAQEVADTQRRKAGREQGIQIASAQASTETEKISKLEETSLRVSSEALRLAAKGRVISRAGLTDIVAAGGPGHVDYVIDAIKGLCARGVLAAVGGNTYVVPPPLQEPRMASVHPLRVEPSIGNVGG